MEAKTKKCYFLHVFTQRVTEKVYSKKTPCGVLYYSDLEQQYINYLFR